MILVSRANAFTDEIQSQKPITLSVIVPVFNEEEVLPIFHHQLSEALSRVSEENVEVVYINDGSSDNSWSVMSTLESVSAQINCINLSRNFGKEAAMSAGLDYAQGGAVIFLDADLQDPPELVPKMLKYWHQGFDVVNMKRRTRAGESTFKRLSAFIYYRLLNFLSDVKLEADVGDFRLLSRRVVDQIRSLPERNRYMKGIMSWPGFKQITVEFDRPERAAGETKWSFVQLVKLAISGITSFSVKPLKMASWFGAALSISAFIYALVVLFKTLFFGESVAGYPSMMLIQLFLGGVQLLAIGILGEYVGRIFVEAKQRPIYLVMDERRLAKKEGVNSETS